MNNKLAPIQQGLLNPPSQNLCYINSTFQCLAACDLLLDSSDPVAELVVRVLQQITQKGGPDHLAILSALNNTSQNSTTRSSRTPFTFWRQLPAIFIYGEKVKNPSSKLVLQQSCLFLIIFNLFPFRVIIGKGITQTRCTQCNQWSLVNQAYPIVGCTVSCLPNPCTLGEAIQHEWKPTEVQSGGHGWEWW